MCAPMCCQAGCSSAQFNFLLDFAFYFSYITVKMAAQELRSSFHTDHKSHVSVVFMKSFMTELTVRLGIYSWAHPEEF